MHAFSILGLFSVSAHCACLLAMAYILSATVLLIAFAQQCIADISNSSPELWYSANVTYDGSFKSEPHAEKSLNEGTFSTTNPIVVAPSTDLPFNVDEAWISADKVVPNIWKSQINLQSDYVKSLSNSKLYQKNDFSVPDSQPRTSFDQWPILPIQYRSPMVGISQVPGSPKQNHPLLFFYQHHQPEVENLSTLPPTSQPATIPPSSVSITTPGSSFAPIHASGIFSTTTPSMLQDTVSTYLPKDISKPFTEGTEKHKNILSNFKIRVVAPKGSVTNVKINPPSTTKKPTTTKKWKSKKENRKSDYRICVNSCKNKKHPVCTAPLGVTPIDPDKLKGFISLCQMACHNSFQKIRYQKITEGRCGRLRTRIRSLNSRKLKKDELVKSQYTVIISTTPHTVFEFKNINTII